MKLGSTVSSNPSMKDCFGSFQCSLVSADVEQTQSWSFCIRSSKELPPRGPRGYASERDISRCSSCRNLFIPCGTPLYSSALVGDESLRQLLANDPKRLTWLRPLENTDQFRAEIAAAVGLSTAFSTWIDYTRSKNAERLHKPPGEQSSFGNFDRFVRRLRPSESCPTPRTDQGLRCAALPPNRANEVEASQDRQNICEARHFCAREFKPVFRANGQAAFEPISETAAEEKQPRRVPIEEALQNALAFAQRANFGAAKI